MQKKSVSLFLFSIIFIEGYAVLASELIAIRLLIPFVGSGVEMIAIVVSSVLLPLAAGYHFGGKRYSDEVRKLKKRNKLAAVSIRKILIRNIIEAMILLTFGLSFLFLELFFAILKLVGIESLLQMSIIYCLVFLVYPVFLLAQTVPLISNYFSRSKLLSQMTGRMLFFSTLGSFMGSILSTLVLMNTIGVNLTAFVVILCLCVSVFMLCRTWRKFDNLIAVFLVVIMYVVNDPAMYEDLNIVSNNAYNVVHVKEVENGQAIRMDINRSFSSQYSQDQSLRWGYVKFIENTILFSAPKPLDVLILGAGGFTIGYSEERHNYTYVDIDPNLKKVSEEHMLPSPLKKNQKFIPVSARAYLNGTDKKFDVIIADAYTNAISVPSEMTTVEFWQQLNTHLKDEGVLAANMLIPADYGNLYSVRITNTFTSVFPDHIRQAVEKFSIWESKQNNIIYLSRKNENSDDRFIYKDNLNPQSLDKHR